MIKLIIALTGLAGVFIAYVYWVRPYLRSLPQLGDLLASHDDFFGAVRAWLDGRKTVLTGIWGSIIAFAPDLLNLLNVIDLKTIFNLPDQWAAIVAGITAVLTTIFRTMASKEA